MCGIAGIVNFDGLDDRAAAGRMIAAQRHRGPDALRTGSDGVAGLGHARLSIIDLAGGQQPLGSVDRRWWITFNGELFNYRELREELEALGRRFATSSDTEVIVNAYCEWGERCLDRFNGDWAFAIWDTVQRELFLARDRVGVRPLYYTWAEKKFLFASEIKGLLAHGGVEARVNLAALHDIFTLWAPTPPETVFEGIFEIPPAHWMRVSPRGVHVQRYWDIPFADESIVDRSRADDARWLEAMLQEATRLRLRADVPVGAYVSGGLDSAVVAALARRATTGELRTFSISFADPEFDESRWQADVVQSLGCRHETVRCEARDIARVFSQVVRHAERPILRTAPAPMYLLAERVRQAGLKVVLTGEGADEVCGGYDIFKETKVRSFWARQPESPLRARLLARLYPYQPRLQRQSDAYLQAFFQLGTDSSDPFFSHRPRWSLGERLLRVFSPDVRAAWANDNVIERLASRLPSSFRGLSPLHRAQYLETTHLLPGYILSSQGDRMAMAHGVEGRFPFLDVHLLEAAAAWPARWKLSGLNEKSLLKEVARQLAPASVVERPKQPYRAPDGAVFFAKDLDAETRDTIDHLLSPGQLESTGLFHAPAVERLVTKFRRGATTSVADQMALVGVLSTQSLVEQFCASTPRASCSASPFDCSSHPQLEPVREY